MTLFEASRILLFGFMSAIPFFLWKQEKLFCGKFSRNLLLILIFISIGIGIDYVFYHVLLDIIAEEANGTIKIEEYFVISIASIFVLTQAMAAILFLQNNSNYIAWLIPPMLYFFVIGTIAVVRFDIISSMVADMLRAILMFYLMYLNRKMVG